jgi:hypothetical protein
MEGVAVKPLTVSFHETPFLSKLNQENKLGFWFQLDGQARQQAGEPWGPSDPQALNRYSYVQNNPLKYTDPTGHIPAHKGHDPISGRGYEQACVNGAGSVVNCSSNSAVDYATDENDNFLYWIYDREGRELVSQANPFLNNYITAIDRTYSATVAVAGGALGIAIGIPALAICVTGTGGTATAGCVLAITGLLGGTVMGLSQLDEMSHNRYLSEYALDRIREYERRRRTYP